MAARLTTYVVVGIVAATLIAGLIAGAQRDDNDGPVDLIVQNGRIFTAERSGTTAEAIAVRGNRVLRVGSNRDINRLRRPQTLVVDANGAAVLPGFNDAHAHFIAGGLALEHVDLNGAAALGELLERVRTWADGNADPAWVLGRGWTFAAFEDGVPSREMLDEIVGDRPALLLSADGAAAWVNSRALEIARITRRAPDPPNGTIVRDARSGEPSGLLKGAAVRLVAGRIPKPSREDRARALQLAITEAHRNGITSVQTADGDEQDFELYERARKAGDLKVRVVSTVALPVPVTDEDLDRLEDVRRRYPDDPLFKTGALKISVDGAGDTQSAAMPAAYGARAPTSAEPAIAPDDLNRTVRLADARGWQVVTHATGHRAVRMALDAYQHAARSNLAPARGRRHRIEHARQIDADDVRRFGALGVVASVQPLAHARHGTRTRPLGVDRAARAWPFRSVTDAGVRIAFGSDWPAAPMNPLLGVHAAVAPTTDPATDAATPAERLTLEAALKAYTSVPAWAAFDDQRKGTLAPGMLADIVVLSDDIFEKPATTLAAASVEVTIFDGKIVYRRGGNSGTD